MKSKLIICLLAISTNLFSQDSTATMSAWQQELTSKVKNLQQQLTELSTAIADSTHADEQFKQQFMDEVYATQRQLEDISYQVYERKEPEPVVEDPSLADTTWAVDPSLTDDSGTPDFGSGFPGMKKQKSPRTVLRVGFGFGFSDLADLTDRTTGVFFPSFDFGKSGFNSWQFLFETRLGKRDSTEQLFGGFNPKKPWKRNNQFKSSKVSIISGITIDRYRLVETGDAVLTTTANDEGTFGRFGQPVKHNTIIINTLTLPVQLKFSVGKDLALRAGVFAGIRVAARQNLTYTQNDFDIERTKKDNFDLAKFTYGVSGGIGWDGFYLFGKFGLNPFFKNSETYDFRLFSYGLTLSL